MDSSPIVVLFEPSASRAHRPHGASTALNTGLRAYGFHVGACHDLHRLTEYIDGRPDACLVLGGSLAQNCVAASHVRARAPDIGILALVPSMAESILIAVLHSGVDTYCPASASAGLVAAVVSGMFRRVGRPVAGAPASPHWFLSDQAWVLVGAGGGRVPLTTGERAFLSALLGAPGMRASHGELIAAVSKAYGEPVAPRAHSRLRLLAARLRRKCQVHGEILPLSSVHGWGYMFAGSVPP